MELTDRKKPFSLDVKRFYIPGAKLEGECPNCHAYVEHDLGEQYLSYPNANGVNEVGLWCDECEHEWTVKVRLHVTLALEE